MTDEAVRRSTNVNMVVHWPSIEPAQYRVSAPSSRLALEQNYGIAHALAGAEGKKARVVSQMSQIYPFSTAFFMFTKYRPTDGFNFFVISID